MTIIERMAEAMKPHLPRAENLGPIAASAALRAVRPEAVTDKMWRADERANPKKRLKGFAITPERAREEAQKLMATEAYANRNHPDHIGTIEHVQMLFERAYLDDCQ